MGAGASQTVLSGLVREVAGILRRQWLLAVPPAALLGAGAGVVVVARKELGAELALGVLLAVAFEFYVGWAELVVAADRGEGPPPRVRGMTIRAAAAVPGLLVASVVAVMLPLAAGGLLVLPGLWLLTRWSLFAPAIVHERLRWRQALARSSALVRGAFWAVAASVTASVLVEHAVIHGTAHTFVPATGSAAVALAGAAIATTAVSPAAAFTISIVYERLERAGECPPNPDREAHTLDGGGAEADDGGVGGPTGPSDGAAEARPKLRAVS